MARCYTAAGRPAGPRRGQWPTLGSYAAAGGHHGDPAHRPQHRGRVRGPHDRRAPRAGGHARRRRAAGAAARRRRPRRPAGRAARRAGAGGRAGRRRGALRRNAARALDVARRRARPLGAGPAAGGARARPAGAGGLPRHPAAQRRARRDAARPHRGRARPRLRRRRAHACGDGRAGLVRRHGSRAPAFRVTTAHHQAPRPHRRRARGDRPGGRRHRRGRRGARTRSACSGTPSGSSRIPPASPCSTGSWSRRASGSPRDGAARPRPRRAASTTSARGAASASPAARTRRARAGTGLPFSDVFWAITIAEDLVEPPSPDHPRYFPRKETGFPDVYLRPDPATLRRVPWLGGEGWALGEWHLPDGCARAARPAGGAAARARRRGGARPARAGGLRVRVLPAGGHGRRPRGARLRRRPADRPHAPLHLPRPARRAGPRAPGAPGGRARPRAGWCWSRRTARRGRARSRSTSATTTALRAADDAFLFKQAVKAMAAADGRTASFMAKPREDWAGSSCHVHVSLWSPDGGENLLATGPAGQPNALAGQAIAGPARDAARGDRHPLPDGQQLEAARALQLGRDDRLLGLRQPLDGDPRRSRPSRACRASSTACPAPT